MGKYIGTNKRLVNFDIAKAICIILVVIGHYSPDAIVYVCQWVHLHNIQERRKLWAFPDEKSQTANDPLFCDIHFNCEHQTYY